MKELLIQYADYNVWANERLNSVILQLNEEQQHQPIVSSFPGIYKTLLHMWDAEIIWWQRVDLKEKIIIPSRHLTPTLSEVAEGLLAQSQQWKDWVATADDDALHREFAYHNIKGEPFKNRVWQILQHLFNHSTYHRGQLITMLRQVGETAIPATDFIAFTRI